MSRFTERCLDPAFRAGVSVGHFQAEVSSSKIEQQSDRPKAKTQKQLEILFGAEALLGAIVHAIGFHTGSARSKDSLVTDDINQTKSSQILVQFFSHTRQCQDHI